jgi:tetratricopeptide (TPR) repeat protein
MKIPDCRELVLNPGVLREPIADGDRMVLWIPGTREGGFQNWQRVGNVPRAPITAEAGLCTTPATAVPARQRDGGFFSKLVPHFGKAAGENTWMLPNGSSAQQSGERQTDLVLAWPADPNVNLDEISLKSHLPQAQRFQQIGKNLFLVFGVGQSDAAEEAKPLPQGNPNEIAERAIAAARQAGDRQQEALALTDLGILTLRQGDARRAAMVLQEALTLAQQLGDRARVRDVVGNLGTALLAIGQAPRAVALIEQELTLAREVAEPFAEKMALEHLGFCHSTLRDPARALEYYDRALALARQVGDRLHEGDLVWSVAIQYAELGQRDQALSLGQAAVDLMAKIGKPEASLFAEHLQKYREGEAGAWLQGNAAAGLAMASAMPLGTNAWEAPPGGWSGSEAGSSGPGLLRMAMSAAKSMAKYLGSGLKAVPQRTHQERLRKCASCEHHTGLRCRLCGCFTTAKAWLPHEACPIGKWPAVSAISARSDKL